MFNVCVRNTFYTKLRTKRFRSTGIGLDAFFRINAVICSIAVFDLSSLSLILDSSLAMFDVVVNVGKGREGVKM